MKKKVIRKQNCSKFCFVCGAGNDSGLHTRFYELEDGGLVGLVTVGGEHQSYPGRVHGGVISAIIDEAIGRAIIVSEPETWGVTAELNMRYKKPVPYDVPLTVTARVVENHRLLYIGEADILLPDGTVAASGRAKYVKMKLADIADFDAHGDFWKPVPEPGDPMYIDIPEA